MHLEDRIAGLFASQHGLITREQAITLGLPPYRVGRLLKKRAWERIHPAVYRLAGAPATWNQTLLAACLAAGPRALASHRSAALLFELPTDGSPIELTIPNSRWIRLNGVVVHRATDLPQSDRRVLAGIPTTTIARTLMDLASVVHADDLEAILDVALSRRLINARHLIHYLKTRGTRGRKGSGILARLLANRLGSPHPAESVFETRLAQALRRRGLPSPAPQFVVQLRGGRRYRVDFAFPDALVAIEADSYRYHASLSDWSRDRIRHNELIAAGWRVLPITFADLRADAGAVADQIARCLTSARRL